MLPRWLRHPALTFALKVVLAGVALALLVRLIEWEAIREAAVTAHPGWALAALALVPLNLWLEAYRWHRLVRRLAPAVRQRESVGAVLSGYPIGLLTPGRVGDYVGRAFYLRHAGRWQLAALTFAERMMTLACCLVFGLAALTLFLLTEAGLDVYAWTTLLCLGLVATAAFLYLLLHPRSLHRLLVGLSPSRRLRSLLRVLGRFSRADAQSLFWLSALRYGVFSTQFVLLVRAFDPATPLFYGYIAVALVFFAKSAIPSFTLADLGIRESASIYFFGFLGVTQAAAFNGALGLFVFNLLLPALVGLPLVLRMRLRADSSDVPVSTAEPTPQAS
ncbi:MAG: lysylphosphatidylglycerol synthase transmembrane domain-containing protein [Bacteroidota bacterium]